MIVTLDSKRRVPVPKTLAPPAPAPSPSSDTRPGRSWSTARDSKFLAAASVFLALWSMPVALRSDEGVKAGSGSPVPIAAEPPGIHVKSREVFFPCSGPGVLVEGQSFYTRREGLEKMCFRFIQTESMKLDSMEHGFSADNGKTWSALETFPVATNTPEGTERRKRKAGWVDPVNGRLLFMNERMLLPNGRPLESLTRSQLWYQVSTDGGHTAAVEEQVIQKGEGYSAEHPLEEVWLGRNSARLGDHVGRPIRTRAGKILQPVQLSLVGEEDGKVANPGGGLSYLESAVLIGTWLDTGRIEWVLSQRVANTPEQSSRGAFEPTIAELPDGRILMVMRGSNTKTTPGCKWYSLSGDGGATWSPIQPWSFSDGTSFYSPSSTSVLVSHSNGRIYWLGNINPRRPDGIHWRYPLMMGVVDPASGLLIHESVAVIDDRAEGETNKLMLTSFLAHEDRATGDILLHMSRPFAGKDRASDAYLYQISVGNGKSP